MHPIADDAEFRELVEKLADAIRRDLDGRIEDRVWAIVGIRSRGDDLAHRLAEILEPDHLGTLDITLYRDDLSELAHPIVRPTDIPFAIDGIDVVLVDDVIMTGRSVRAALQLLLDLGRPRRVWLSVMVDRGGRELPIAPDHVAVDLSNGVAGDKLAADETVDVMIQPTDERDAIVVRKASVASA